MPSAPDRPTRVTALAAGRAYLDAIAANAPGLAAAVRADRAQARARIGATLQQTMLDFLSITPGWDAHSPRSVAIAAFVGHGWAGTICAWLAGELPLERTCCWPSSSHRTPIQLEYRRQGIKSFR